MSNGARSQHVWILRGAKPGDYAQMRSLAGALNWPFEVRQIEFRDYELLLHVWPRPTMLGVDLRMSDTLKAPFPDLLLTAGRRNELPARWIKRESGGRTRIVHVGRPWSHPRHFDLVISSAQYGLPAGPNVIVNTLPIVAPLPVRDDDEWPKRLSSLPRPWTGVLVGGNSGPWVWTRRRCEAFASALRASVEASGGSALIVTSARTSRRLYEFLVEHCGDLGIVHDYKSPADNPYRAILSLADRFVVTADSLSMLADALAMDREVRVHDHLGGKLSWFDPTAYRWRPLVHRLALLIGPRRMRRDPQALHRVLIEQGAIAMLTDPSPMGARPPPSGPADMARSVAAVQRLFEPKT